VPLDDVAYVYIDALVARGQLRALPLLDRPYAVRAIRDALAADRRPVRARGVRRPVSNPQVAELRTRLERALSKYDFASRRRGIVRAELSASLWVTGETSGQRELMMADNEVSEAFLGGAARFLMAAGPFVGFSRPILENRLNTDPDFEAGRIAPSPAATRTGTWPASGGTARSFSGARCATGVLRRCRDSCSAARRTATTIFSAGWVRRG
jgi:hypothetical protein